MASPLMVESDEHRRQLLAYARAVCRTMLGPDASLPAKPMIEGRFGGAFVTFWNGKNLRGCVGTFAATTDLADTIAGVTRASLRDGRFAAHPITLEELPNLTIEISILSDPVPTDDPLSLTPGEHGIIIRRGARSGCFLPNVASEHGWSAEELLSTCCTMKAGLPADAWRSPDTEVLLFVADVFAEPTRA